MSYTHSSLFPSILHLLISFSIFFFPLPILSFLCSFLFLSLESCIIIFSNQYYTEHLEYSNVNQSEPGIEMNGRRSHVFIKHYNYLCCNTHQLYHLHLHLLILWNFSSSSSFFFFSLSSVITLPLVDWTHHSMWKILYSTHCFQLNKSECDQ